MGMLTKPQELKLDEMRRSNHDLSVTGVSGAGLLSISIPLACRVPLRGAFIQVTRNPAHLRKTLRGLRGARREAGAIFTSR